VSQEKRIKPRIRFFTSQKKKQKTKKKKGFERGGKPSTFGRGDSFEGKKVLMTLEKSTRAKRVYRV